MKIIHFILTFLLMLSSYSYNAEINHKNQLSEAVNMNHNDLLNSVSQGRLDFIRSGSVSSPLPGADFKETNENYVYALGIDYVCLNGIIEKNINRIPTEKEIDQAIQFFSNKKLPFMWWTSAKVLETKGFQFGGILTGIALDISKELPAKSLSSSDIEVKVVQTDSELKIFNNLVENAFGMNSKASEQGLAINESLIKKGEAIYFLAYINDVPVGTASLSISPLSAGVWNLSSLPEYRKQGVGGALVYAALVEAKKRRYNQVMAILMPKGLAWGLFTKLGFEAVYEFPFYIYGVSAEELEK